MGDETFNASYYSTAAQVIPVFIAAAGASSFWRGQDRASPEFNMGLIGVVLVSLAGEMSALEALRSREDPSAFEQSLIGMAFGFPAFFVFAVLVVEPGLALREHSPAWLRRWGARLLELCLAVAIVAFLAFGVDPVIFIGIAAFGFILLPQIFLLWKPVRSLRRDADSESR